MNTSLSDLCLDKISQNILHSPPMIQEIIINTSTEKIEKKMDIKYNLQLKKMVDHIKAIVPRILEDLDSQYTHESIIINNVYDRYAYIPTIAIDSSVEIAKIIHMFYKHKNMFRHPPHMSYYEESNESECDNQSIDYPDEEEDQEMLENEDYIMY